MGMTVLGVVFVFALFAGLILLAQFTRKRVIDAPLNEGRARNSAVAELVDDLQKNKWTVIIGLAVVVAVDKSFRVSNGLLQSRLVMAILIGAFFVGRLWLRRRGQAKQLLAEDDRDRQSGAG